MRNRRLLGRTGLEVCRLGVAAGYGVPAKAVEKAVERGVNYLYYGSARRGGFTEALRNLSRHRDQIVLVVQSYARLAPLVAWSLERALAKCGYDHADVLLLGLWNKTVSPSIFEAAEKLRERGLVRFIAQSTHQRKLVPKIAASGSGIDVVHFRYNAAHPGAETDIFPHVGGDGRPGLVSFTATSWRGLLKAKGGVKAPTALDCYRFVLARSEIDVCMTGPSTGAHMDEALKALDAPEMDGEELKWMYEAGKR